MRSITKIGAKILTEWDVLDMKWKIIGSEFGGGLELLFEFGVVFRDLEWFWGHICDMFLILRLGCQNLTNFEVIL